MKDTRIKLVRKSPLQTDLNRAVQGYFADTGLSQDGGARIAVKAGIIGVWLVGSYLLALLGGLSLPALLLCAVSVGLACAGVGFCIMHDGNHGAFSSSRRVNTAMGYTVDLLGGSSYVWRHKHNVMHHTYPNVVGTDDDINVGFLGRMAPDQPHLSFHKWQHIYMWPLYAFITVKWHMIDDFRDVATGMIGSHAFPRPKGKEMVAFLATRFFFFGWILVLPIAVLGLGTGLAMYFVAMWSLGVTLAVVFQLAHCVEEAAFPANADLAGDAPVALDFARMQLDSTVDFARGNRVVTWYLGGLNYQTIHHLFPRISHIHYPALSRIIEQVCTEHGVAYRTTGTFMQALASHQRWLKRMGHGEGAVRQSAVVPSAAAIPSILEAPTLEPDVAMAG